MDKESFDFISDQNVKSNIIDSIDFSIFLQLISGKIPQENREESYRTIILYAASVIEALLLYYLSKKNLFLSEDKFIHISILPNQFKNDLGEIVVAIRKTVKRNDADFSKVIDFLEKMLGKNLAKNIHKIRETRNTFHLLKTRTKIQEKDVEHANATLLKLVKKIQIKLE